MNPGAAAAADLLFNVLVLLAGGSAAIASAILLTPLLAPLGRAVLDLLARLPGGTR